MDFDEVLCEKLLSDHRPLIRRKGLRQILASPAKLTLKFLDTVVAPLLDLDETRTRSLAASVLLRFNDEMFLNRWSNLLEDEQFEVVSAAQKALVELGAKAVPMLIDKIINKTNAGRRWATETLGRIGLDALPMLLELADSQDNEIAYRGRHALNAMNLWGRDPQELNERMLTATDSRTRYFLQEQLVQRAGDQSLDTWLEQASHPKELMRQTVARALSDFGNQECVVEALVVLLFDQPIVATSALKSIVKIDAVQAVPEIVKLFHDKSEFRGQIVETFCDWRGGAPPIVQCGGEALPYVKKMIAKHEGNDSWRDRMIVSSALEMIKELVINDLVEMDESLFSILLQNVDDYQAEEALIHLGANAVPQLIQALNDQPETIPQLAYVLGQIQDPRASSPLRQLMSQGDPPALTHLILALGRLGDQRALPDILGRADHHDWQVREAVFESLADLRCAAALQVVEQGLKDPQREVRFAAARVLGEVPELAAVEMLVAVLDRTEDSGLREECVVAAGKQGRRAVATVPVLQELLTDPTYYVKEYYAEAWDKEGGDAHYWIRLHAAIALGQIGESAAAPSLVKASQDNPKDWWVREEIANALGKLDGEVAKAGLERLREDLEEAVRLAAERSLLERE